MSNVLKWTFLLNVFSFLAVKLMGKLQDGTVFVKKGYDEEPFEFTIDEGNVEAVIFCYLITRAKFLLVSFAGTNL